MSDKDLRRPAGPRANPERRGVRANEGAAAWLHHVRVSLRWHSALGWGGAPRQSPSIRFGALFTRFALGVAASVGGSSPVPIN